MNTSPSAPEVYASAILDRVPHVLSLMDREGTSPTAGCCDRTYWAWKFVDFPGARFQEALYVLSFLYSTHFDNSNFLHNSRLLEWIKYGLSFWSSIQYQDGSFDEAYPFERSLAATAFTTFYIAEALQFINDYLPVTTISGLRKTIARAGKWLTKNDETHGFLSNHLAAAAAALHHVYRITGEEIFENRSKYFLRRIIDHQSDEGWYEEYGGADPGYQTHGSFYLARYWQLTKDRDLEESLARSIEFLAYFVHPDGSFGGEYASRNTQTYYPAAFEMLADRHPAAAWIAETMRSSILSGSAAGIRSVDVYNYFPFLNNLVFAYTAFKNEARTEADLEEPASQLDLAWFPEAGIARIRRESYDAYVGTAKGGVIKIFDRSKRKLVYSDCGYIGQLHNGRIISNHYQDQNRKVEVNPVTIKIESCFSEVPRPTMTPPKFVAFRLFSLLLGRLPVLARWLKGQLVKALIYRRKSLDIYLERSIEFGKNSATVSDTISGPGGKRVNSLVWKDIFTTVHMGSSRYFINNELNEILAYNPNGTNEISPGQIESGVELRRIIKLDQEE
jgi:hypothetical protein